MEAVEREIVVVKPTDDFYVEQCESIVCENSRERGGTLRSKGLHKYSDYVVCVTDAEKNVMGFAYLEKTEWAGEPCYCIMQIAVKKSEQNKGIASSLMNYIIDNSKEVKYLYSHVRKSNTNSNLLHDKFGFKKREDEDMKFRYECLLDVSKTSERKKMRFTETQKKSFWERLIR